MAPNRGKKGGAQGTPSIEGKGVGVPQSGIAAGVKHVLAEFTDNFKRALVLFIVFSLVRVAAQTASFYVSQHFGTTSVPLASQPNTSPRQPVHRLYQMAMATLDAGMLHEASFHFDLIIVLVSNSSAQRELLAECLIHRASILLAYAARALRLDTDSAYLTYDLQTDTPTSGMVCLAEWIGPTLRVVPREQMQDRQHGKEYIAEEYSFWPPTSLVDEALASLSEAAEMDISETPPALLLNLGLAVLTSQCVLHPAEHAVATVVQNAVSSLEQMQHKPTEKVAELLSDLAPILLQYDQSKEIYNNLLTVLKKRTSEGGFLARIEGLKKGVEFGKKKGFSDADEWVAVQEADGHDLDQFDGGLDASTLSAGSAGAKRALRQRELFRQWLPMKGHISRIHVHHNSLNADDPYAVFHAHKAVYPDTAADARDNSPDMLATYHHAPSELLLPGRGA